VRKNYPRRWHPKTIAVWRTVALQDHIDGAAHSVDEQQLLIFQMV
jgi:hypothetical protein